MSEHNDESVNRSGPSGTFGCACASTDARMCYLIRYDVDPPSECLTDDRCECLCHQWSEDDSMDTSKGQAQSAREPRYNDRRTAADRAVRATVPTSARQEP